MFRKQLVLLMIAASMSLMKSAATAQEFPIAVGSDTTFGQGGAFDGTHYLMGLVTNHYDLTAQFVTEGGSLYGSRFSLGVTGSGLAMAFDGTNYLAVWTDPFPIFASGDTNGIGNLYGKFISPSGSVGSTFNLIAGVNMKFARGRGGIIFRDTDYLLFYLKGGQHQDHLFCQRIDKSGNLSGSPVQISTGYARETSAAFDGTNYLFAWCEGSGIDEFIYGQFIGKGGSLVGSNFLIDGSPNKSDNPVSVTFDGEQYFVAFHDQAANDTGWNLYGRFVTPSGEVASNRVMICDSTRMPDIPSVAFDGTDYLATWIETAGPVKVKGRFFCTTGVPIDTAFTVFDTLGGKMPLGGVSGFLNGHYILGATRVDRNMTDGDVYGKLLAPLTAGGSPLLGTWTKASGPADVLTYYFNSNAVVTMTMDFDTSMTAAYGIDTSVTPRRISWYAGNGKLGNLGIWDVYGDTLLVKATGGDTTTFPTSFGPDPKYNSEATAYVRVRQVTGVNQNRT